MQCPDWNRKLYRKHILLRAFLSSFIRTYFYAFTEIHHYSYRYGDFTEHRRICELNGSRNRAYRYLRGNFIQPCLSCIPDSSPHCEGTCSWYQCPCYRNGKSAGNRRSGRSDVFSCHCSCRDSHCNYCTDCKFLILVICKKKVAVFLSSFVKMAEEKRLL